MGFSDLALACGSESVVDAVCTAVVGSARTGRVRGAFSDREDTSSDVCYVGDTRKSFPEKDDDSIPHTQSLPNNTTGSGLFDIVSHRNNFSETNHCLQKLSWQTIVFIVHS